jgi:putative transposase
MPRLLRYEKDGGLYHVLNRGNYRRPVFGSVGAAQAFETTLWEAIQLHGWRLHAYVLMTNHYHLALETPQPNLGQGMHWLHSTFATRFNRLRDERGHLFQGRYRALAIEDTHHLVNVVDYIHLNPLRAKLVPIERLAEFRWCSLRRFLRGDRPAGLTGDLVTTHLGLADTPAGWQDYVQSLAELAADEEEQKRRGFGNLSRGWAIGSHGWRAALAKTMAQRDLAGLAQAEAKEIRELQWTEALHAALRQAGKTPADLTPLKPRARGEDWRWQLALALRAQGVTYAWIAQHLGYASAASLRVRMHSNRIN